MIIKKETSKTNGEKIKNEIFSPELKEISEQDKQQMREIYKIRPTYVNGVYITPVQQPASYMIRMTFQEHNFSIGGGVPVCALIISLDDFINNYQLMTEYLNNLKEKGVLK